MKLRTDLHIASATDKGVVRNFNEDSIAVNRELGLIVLADGMGGYKAGNVASNMATSLIVDELQSRLGHGSGRGSLLYAEPQKLVREALEKTNQLIFRTARTEEKYQGMGTTVVLMQFYDNRATIAHVGDSRLYRWRQGYFEILTRDHSLLQEQVALGMISFTDARYSHNRNLVTRALGTGAEVELEIREIDVQPGDLYLLCSDGLNDMVDDFNIELAMNELQGNLPLMARQLVLMANDNGGHDNVSVIVAQVPADSPPGSGLKNAFFNWLRRIRS
ncbi:MAG TPA: Stp1/IreP family PP2C-type Ser/Thr phosphatase [Burkholderiales bacterium]|nr:Stp1/IreP family PP2C-type Ser/Thr phosphatase [Burkholderiales bacterium]